MQIAMIKNIYYLFYFRLYFCTVMIALILAKIRKINKYVSLNMVLFNGFSSVIEKGLKFGYMAINIKHSTIFFRKVAAPTGQNDFKKIFFFQLRFFSH